MAFEPFDLARIVQNAEALKTMRSNAATDELQRQYLGQRMQTDRSAEARAAQQESRAAAQEGRAVTEFGQEQQLTNTKLLNMAAAEVADNPAAAQRWDPIIKAAIPNWQSVQGDPEQIRASALKLRDSTAKALAAYQQGNLKSTDIPSNVQEYLYYRSLPTEEQQKFLEMKRSLNPYSAIDLGGGRSVLDRRTGETKTLTTAEQEAAGQAQVESAKAGAKTSAESTAKAAFDLPRLEQNATQALQVLEQLKSHPGLERITGLYGKVPIVPGSPGAAAAALADQIQGKTFLEAYNTLRGGGQITEVEGEKAQNAIARLNRSQSTADYVTALNELEDVIRTGLERARKQAGGTQQSAAPNPGRFQIEEVSQ